MLTFSRVTSDTELDEVIHLVTAVYKEEGFVESREDAHSTISDYLKLPSAAVFSATYDGILLGTISVVEDSDAGLPMDVIFKEELDQKRKEGSRIAEVCQFAIDKKKVEEISENTHDQKLNTSVSMGLLKLVFHYGLYRKLDYLALTINPRHRAFYESLGCVQLGEEKQYPSVNNAPALAYLLDLHAIMEGEGQQERAGGWFIKEVLDNAPDYALFETM